MYPFREPTSPRTAPGVSSAASQARLKLRSGDLPSADSPSGLKELLRRSIDTQPNVQVEPGLRLQAPSRSTNCDSFSKSLPSASWATTWRPNKERTLSSTSVQATETPPTDRIESACCVRRHSRRKKRTGHNVSSSSLDDVANTQKSASLEMLSLLPGESTPARSRSPQERRKRKKNTNVACRNCVKAKAACDAGRPCKR